MVLNDLTNTRKIFFLYWDQLRYSITTNKCLLIQFIIHDIKIDIDNPINVVCCVRNLYLP